MEQEKHQTQQVVIPARTIAEILRWGLVLCLLGTGAGVLLLLTAADQALPPLSPSWQWLGGLLTFAPASWVAGGITVLLLTPLVSVGVFAWEMGCQRQWKLLLAAVAVIVILLVGLAAGMV